MCKILCSTGALVGLANNRDYRILEKVSKELHCDGFEFMMYNSWYEKADAIVDALLGMEINIPIMHCEKNLGEAISKGEFEGAFRRFEINCHMAKCLKAEKMVVHLWDGITSDSNFDNNKKAYATLADVAGKYGIDLLVENVVCNREDPMKHWCELAAEYPGIRFVFDTKMAAFHEQLDLLYEKEYEWLWKNSHIVHYHVNDYAGGYKEWEKLRTYPIGQGHIDFARFFEHIKKNGYKGTFTLEAAALRSDGTVDVGLMNEQIDFVRRALGI